MFSLFIFSIIGFLFFYSHSFNFRLFLILTLLVKLLISLLIFTFFNFDISNTFGDQLVYIDYANSVYKSSTPFGTRGNVSHYLYVFMLTVLLNFYQNLFLSTIDLIFSQIGASILTHLLIFKIVAKFIQNKYQVLLISSLSLLFFTLHSYNIFLLRDSWFYLFLTMSLYYLVLNKYNKSVSFFMALIFSLLLLLQMRFFTALFFIVAYFICFTKNKFSLILFSLLSFSFFIFIFGFFYNINMIGGYLLTLLDPMIFIDFLLYNVEGFFNLSFLRFSDYGTITKFIRIFIPETIFMIISFYFMMKLKKYKVLYLDNFIKFIIVLTFFHISTYFFFSGAEWKIRQSGILSLFFTIFISIKYFAVKSKGFKISSL